MNEKILNTEQYDFIKYDDKRFIIEFSNELERLGYTDFGIGNGFCWGRYMIIYRKSGMKSQNVYARIYIRDNSICLRLFFNNVTKHGDYIAITPDFIKNVFTGDYGKCKHCKGDSCKFRKDYEIGGNKYEKCNGYTFEFYEPTVEKLPAYIDLFKVFNCKKGDK
ncbi:hypothetical protein EOM82_08450 [bacterium]|nr:hypothetical protein [bacterium]